MMKFCLLVLIVSVGGGMVALCEAVRLVFCPLAPLKKSQEVT